MFIQTKLEEIKVGDNVLLNKRYLGKVVLREKEEWAGIINICLSLSDEKGRFAWSGPSFQICEVWRDETISPSEDWYKLLPSKERYKLNCKVCYDTGFTVPDGDVCKCKASNNPLLFLEGLSNFEWIPKSNKILRP